MNKNMIFTLLVMTPLLLSGCDAEDNAQIRIGRGCEAALRTLLNKPEYDRQIKVVKSEKFGMSDGFRMVTLETTTQTKEFDHEKDESFYCKFEESSGPFGLGWKADLVSTKIDGDIYGTEGGEIYGDIEDQSALTDAVAAAMK